MTDQFDLFAGPEFTGQTIKKKGKLRHLDIPNETMRELHYALLSALHDADVLADVHKWQSATNGLPGTSSLGNARRHVQSRFFYLIDASKAFINVPVDRLVEPLQALLNEEVLQDIVGRFGLPKLDKQNVHVDFIRRYCRAEHGGLAVGAPASPLLFNLYCAHYIDPVLRTICKTLDVTYSRYADDFSFSAKEPVLSRTFRRKLRTAITAAGLTLNDRKAELLDVERGPVTVTGFRINKKQQLEPTRSFLKKIDDLLHDAMLDSRIISSSKRILRFELKAMTASKREVGYSRQEVSGMLAHLFSCTDKETTPRVRRLQGLCKQLFPKLIPDRRKKYKRYVEPALVEHIRRESDILTYISKRFTVIQKANRYWILCPLHEEKTPSFLITPEHQFFKCFGCGIGGDIFQFVMELEGFTFPQAVDHVQQELNISDPPE